jgi:hypothetical protein
MGQIMIGSGRKRRNLAMLQVKRNIGISRKRLMRMHCIKMSLGGKKGTGTKGKREMVLMQCMKYGENSGGSARKGWARLNWQGGRISLIQ